MPAPQRADASATPAQPFAPTHAERVDMARRHWFENGLRPTGLVNEAVIQSWMRCVRVHADQRRMITFDAVTPSRLHATLGRNRVLLEAARGELRNMEDALAGTESRVLLTDASGVVVHATHHPMAAHQPVLACSARVGINISEQRVGTTAPGITGRTGQACAVRGGEHYFDALREMRCAAAPIRDVHGRVAAVLDVSVEGREFGFDAMAVVSTYAATIENRLLRAQAGEQILLRFQASAALLGTPLEALAGVAADGRLAWLNGAAQRLLGPQPDGTPRAVLGVLGLDVFELLRLARSERLTMARLPSGLGVWLMASLPPGDGIDFRHAVTVDARGPSVAPSRAGDGAAESGPHPGADHDDAPSLQAHNRRLIEQTLAASSGNISLAARQLHVSRGTLYRCLARWRESDAGLDDGADSAPQRAG